MAAPDVDQRVQDALREYLDFLDDEEGQGKYSQLVKNMVADNSRRLIVNVNDLRSKNPQRAAALLNNSFEEQMAFQKALKEFVFTVAPDYGRQHEEFFIGFEGSFGNKHVTPRTLTTRYLGNLICVEGIVTRCTLVLPKLVKSVHYCPATKKFLDRRYTDMTSLEAFPSAAVYPTKDDDGNPIETEFGLSTYIDHQTVSIQEMPEKSPAGQLPRHVDIICENDLVDRCKPGDRVQIVGNFRVLPHKYGGYTSAVFNTIVIANNLTQLSKEMIPEISREDVAQCKQIARSHKNIFALLAKSLAPSIHGHEYVKKAILCLLLGGVEKNLSTGTRLRGDINVLLIGDPSVAKSQMLRYVLYTAPRAITTTGRGSSGVGLTAAVTTDQETGERRLEAGAMVLADRGVICIDEFDKMSDIDRTAIHEVMEQGKVTIAKAGIHASLNARCAVLAAANPVYGKYNQYKTPMENIALQDSLLSRFDLLFVMLDTIDEDQDLMIADHVVRMHRYRSPLEQDGDVLPSDTAADMLSTMNLEETGTKRKSIYEEYDALLHGGSRKRSDKILSVDFMRKYIHFVKILKPELTNEAVNILTEEYVNLRSEEALENDLARTQPVTVRTFETMIRLATAHAKARMSRTVQEEDAMAAIELVQYAYFKRVLERETKKRRRDAVDSGSEEEVMPTPRTKRTRRLTSQSSEIVQEIAGILETTAETMETTPSTLTPISAERLNQFKELLNQTFKENHASSLGLTRIEESVNQGIREPFSQEEIQSAIEQMTEDNQVMLSDGILFLI